MKEYFNWDNIFFKIKFFLFPQFVFSILIAFGYPYIIMHVCTQLSKWIYEQTEWSVFDGIWLLSIFIFPFAFFILFYVFYGRYLIKVFTINEFSRKFSNAILPCLIGFIASSMIFIHHRDNKNRIYNIQELSEIRTVSDSNEIYIIKNYFIPYNDYYYMLEVINNKRGSRFSKYDVTEIAAYIICPLLPNQQENIASKEQKTWVSFYFSKELQGRYDKNSPAVKETEAELLGLFNEQQVITHFKEGTHLEYEDLLIDKFNNDSSVVKGSKILEAHFSQYVPYDGFQFILIAVYILLGGNFLVFIIIFFTGINDLERMKILKR